MREEADARLDRIESLAPGSGALDLFGFAAGTLDQGQAGAGVEYKHRINNRAAAFASGEIGYGYGTGPRGLYYKTLAGLRLKF